jgi:hypothetical protein
MIDITPEFKKHMEDMWTVAEIDGVKVVNRHLGFGSLPDIKLTLENGSFLSAKDLFKNVTKTS